jgi:hypothetical protein
LDRKRSYSLESLVSLAPLLAVVAGLLAWSVLQELRLGLWDDVALLINLSERLLDGQRPYADFGMDNPPASLLIYVLPTELARLLGLSADSMTQVFVFIGTGASVAFCIRLANESGAARDLGQVGLLATVAALLVLPACAFAQRDHIALIAALPMLVVMGIRASGRRVRALSATVAGLGGGLMVVIRPHYAVALGLGAVYVAWRRGLRSAAFFPEFYAAGLVGVAYLIIVLLFFPNFFSEAMPMALAVYASAKMDAQDLILRKPTGLIWATLAVLALVYRRQVAASPFAMVAALASAGAFWSYVFQGKGFPYHGYVALALAFVAVALALQKAPRTGFLSPVGMAIGFCIAIATESATGIWSVATVATILAIAVIALAVSFLPERMAFKHVRWSIVSFGVLFVAFGQAKAWHQSEWQENPPFLDEVEKLGPLKLEFISAKGNYESYAKFLADRPGERWSRHVYPLGVTKYVDIVLDQQIVDEPTRQRLQAYRRREQDLLLEDITREKPDAILMEERAATDYLAKETLQAIVRHYRLVSATRGENSDLDPLLQFYVRKPLAE